MRRIKRVKAKPADVVSSLDALTVSLIVSTDARLKGGAR